MRKIIISESQAGRIVADKWGQKSVKSADTSLQEDYLYHRGRNVDVDNPEPHHSENRWHKWEGAGHETGSFGSGMYFTSRFSRDDRFNDAEKTDIFHAEYNPNLDNKKFIQIGQGLYRVNTDFFKNLYVLKSQNEGDLLVELMENINAYVRSVAYSSKANSTNSTKSRQRMWILIQNYAKMLGLRVPWDYRGFYEFSRDYIKNESIKQTPATIFMELNGFNGVDASHAGKYDTYWQGSVIYDLNKVSEITPVLGPRDEFQLRYNDLNRNMTGDVIARKENPTTYSDGSYGRPKDEPTTLLKALKRYPYVLPAGKLWSLPDDVKSKYLGILYNNLKTGYVSQGLWGGEPVRLLRDGEYIKNIIKTGHTEYMNLDKKLTEYILFELSFGLVADKARALEFINAYNGDIMKDFPAVMEDVAEEFNL